MTIDRELFEIQKDTVDWLMSKGLDFHASITLVNYAFQSDLAISEAYTKVYIAASKVIDKEQEEKDLSLA